jgi:hypothetical protein
VTKQLVGAVDEVNDHARGGRKRGNEPIPQSEARRVTGSREPLRGWVR